MLHNDYKRMTKVSKIRKRKSSLRRLTGALKDLLDEKIFQGGNDTLAQGTELEPSAVVQRENEDGIKYIFSKENQMIPKLSDEEVLERHKRADENMKQVWNQIIKKYENMQDQGDVLDLRTGEILEDNGHLRSMKYELSDDTTSMHDEAIRYRSVLKDIIEIKDYEGSVWDERQQDEDEESDISDPDEESLSNDVSERTRTLR